MLFFDNGLEQKMFGITSRRESGL